MPEGSNGLCQTAGRLRYSYASAACVAVGISEDGGVVAGRAVGWQAGDEAAEVEQSCCVVEAPLRCVCDAAAAYGARLLAWLGTCKG